MKSRLWSLLVLLVPVMASGTQKYELQHLQTTARTHGLDLSVDKTTHPGQPAVVLLDRQERTRNYGSGVWIKEHRLVKVLCASAPGVSNARFVVPKDALSSLQARTHAPSGKVVWLSGGDFHHETIQSRDPMSPAAEVISFGFPAVEDGALLEYGYAAKLGEGFTADVYLFGEEYPVQVSQYVVGYPPNNPAPKVSLRPERDRGRIRKSSTLGNSAIGLKLRYDTYEARDLPALPYEAYALPDLSNRLHLFVVENTLEGAQQTWDHLAKGMMWAGKWADFELEEPFRAARQIFMRHDTDEARAHAVASYLKRKLELETREDVSGRWLEQILESGVASPLQFSMLLAALLPQANVQARLGLVNSSTNIPLDQRIPWSGFFDRFLVVTRGKGGSLYFDTLSRDLENGMPRWDCQGQPMLMASFGSHRDVVKAKLVMVPYVPASRNTVQRRADVRLEADGRARIVFEQTILGEPARDLADVIRSEGLDEARRLMFAELQDALPDADFDSVKLVTTSPSSATVSATIETLSLGLHTQDGYMLIPGVLSRQPEVDRLLSLTLGDRRQGIDLRYARRHRTTVSVQGAPGVRFGPLPSKVTLDGPNMHFEQSMTSRPQGFQSVSSLEIRMPAVKHASLPALESFLRGRAAAESRAIAADGVSPIAAPPRPDTPAGR